jgi:hypothetical protein
MKYKIKFKETTYLLNNNSGLSLIKRKHKINIFTFIIKILQTF